MPRFEDLSSGQYRIQDRRGYEFGSHPAREAIASALGMYFGGTGRVAEAAGMYPQRAGILENQLGLSDIPSAGLGAQGIGMLKQFLGPDPVQTQRDSARRATMGGKLWEEMSPQEQIDWLTARGFTQGSAK